MPLYPSSSTFLFSYKFEPFVVTFTGIATANSSVVLNSLAMLQTKAASYAVLPTLLLHWLLYDSY
jgi:hypothetical protein